MPKNGGGILVNTILNFNSTRHIQGPIHISKIKITILPQLNTSLSYYVHQNNSSAPSTSNLIPVFT